MEQYSNLGKVMEARDHFKNKASMRTFSKFGKMALIVITILYSQTSFAQSFLQFIGGLPSGTVLDTVQFVFTVRTPSIRAIDCYPQQITEISKVKDNYQITLTTINPFLDSERVSKIKNAIYDKSHEYDREIAKYLQSTPLIDANNKHIKQIADTLFKNETNTLAIINKALSFVKDFIIPSDSIARQIDAGICRTLDVNTIIQIRKGTCGENSNLFTALMRYMNIPTRYAVGYFYFPEQNWINTHAWAECYIEDIGWCSIDATLNASYIFLHFACIRMRYGLDYEDCDIRTLNHDIEPIEITKVKLYK
jgi:hypothetical protein